MSVTHGYKKWLIFQILTYLAKYFQVGQIWWVWPMFIKSDSFYQLWPIWPNVTHLAQCDPCFKVGQFW